MKVAAFFILHTDCEAVGSFVLSIPDIHWIKNIHRLFNKVVLCHSLPAVCILYLVYNPVMKGVILTSHKSFFFIPNHWTWSTETFSTSKISQLNNQSNKKIQINYIYYPITFLRMCKNTDFFPKWF